MGALDYLSNFCTITSTRGKKKPMQVCMHTYIYIYMISPKLATSLLLFHKLKKGFFLADS